VDYRCPDVSPAFFQNKCRVHRLKITPQRAAIYEEVAKSKAHPSAEQVYRIIRRRFPNISFDTVHRTLLTFSEIGVVDIVEDYGRRRRFDPDVEQHHHLHCIKCGKIADFRCDAYQSLEVPRAVLKGFAVLGKKVVLKGICRSCGAKQ
jgi:Fur family peroxide stress response transcriptional regulator